MKEEDTRIMSWGRSVPRQRRGVTKNKRRRKMLMRRTKSKIERWRRVEGELWTSRQEVTDEV